MMNFISFCTFAARLCVHGGLAMVLQTFRLVPMIVLQIHYVLLLRVASELKAWSMCSRVFGEWAPSDAAYHVLRYIRYRCSGCIIDNSRRDGLAKSSIATIFVSPSRNKRYSSFFDVLGSELRQREDTSDTSVSFASAINVDLVSSDMSHESLIASINHTRPIVGISKALSDRLHSHCRV